MIGGMFFLCEFHDGLGHWAVFWAFSHHYRLRTWAHTETCLRTAGQDGSRILGGLLGEFIYQHCDTALV